MSSPALEQELRERIRRVEQEYESIRRALEEVRELYRRAFGRYPEEEEGKAGG